MCFLLIELKLHCWTKHKQVSSDDSDCGSGATSLGLHHRSATSMASNGRTVTQIAFSLCFWICCCPPAIAIRGVAEKGQRRIEKLVYKIFKSTASIPLHHHRELLVSRYHRYEKDLVFN